MTGLTDLVPQEDSFFDSVVGPGKKYKDVEALAKAYINADMQLHNLTDKLDTVQEKLRQKEKQTQTIDQIVEHIKKPDVSGPDADRINTPPSVQPQSGPTKEEIEQMVKDTLATTVLEKTHADNNAIATQKVVEHFGSVESAQAAIAKVHNNDPQMKKVLDELAGVNPDKAVSLILASNVQEKPTTDSISTMPGVSDAPADAVVTDMSGLTYTQCKLLRQKDPKKYNSPEFRTMMEAAVKKAMDEGKDFFKT